MNIQKNIMLAFIAGLTVLTIWIIMTHSERMKLLDLKMIEIQMKKIEILPETKKKTIW